MAEGGASATPSAVDLAARTRYRRLKLAVLREPRRAESWLTYGVMGGFLAGMVPTFILRTPASLLHGMVAAAMCVLAGAAPLVRQSTRAAFELHVDFALGARASALETVGAPLPSSGAAAQGWVREHGEAATPIVVLIETGRLDAARMAIDGVQAAIDAGSADPRLAVWLDLHRQALRLALGAPASFDGLADRFTALEDPRAATTGLGGLSMLEAAAVVADGGDPLPVLVTGRGRLLTIHPLARAWLLMTGLLLLVTAAAALGAGFVLLALGVR